MALPTRRTRWKVSFQVRTVGAIAALLLIAAIWAGSRGFHEFDSALIGYAVAVVALTFGIVARYARWLRMPSTRRYWRRGWQLATSRRSFRRLPFELPRALIGQLVGQGFIRRRGVVRWIGHQCLFWGVILATLITFPLVFGWLRFRVTPDTTSHYTMYVFGFGTISYPTDTFLGWSLFHALDYTAVLVLAGCAIFFWRRFRDRGTSYHQQLSYDMVPLLMLAAIAVTGMLLTFSSMMLHGAYYEVFEVVHMGTVVLALVFIPFGKFFHVVQRPASVGIQLYTEVNNLEGRIPCSRCGEPLAPGQFVADLRATLTELGQNYTLAPAVPGGAAAQDHHLGELCPRCKRVERAEAFYAASGRSFAR